MILQFKLRRMENTVQVGLTDIMLLQEKCLTWVAWLPDGGADSFRHPTVSYEVRFLLTHFFLFYGFCPGPFSLSLWPTSISSASILLFPSHSISVSLPLHLPLPHSSPLITPITLVWRGGGSSLLCLTDKSWVQASPCGPPYRWPSLAELSGSLLFLAALFTSVVSRALRMCVSEFKSIIAICCLISISPGAVIVLMTFTYKYLPLAEWRELFFQFKHLCGLYHNCGTTQLPSSSVKSFKFHAACFLKWVASMVSFGCVSRLMLSGMRWKQSTDSVQSQTQKLWLYTRQCSREPWLSSYDGWIET